MYILCESRSKHGGCITELTKFTHKHTANYKQQTIHERASFVANPATLPPIAGTTQQRARAKELTKLTAHRITQPTIQRRRAR